MRRSIYEVPTTICFFWFGRKVNFTRDSGSLNVDKGSTNYTLGSFDLMYRQGLSIGDNGHSMTRIVYINMKGMRGYGI